MAFRKLIQKIFKKRHPKPALEYVRDESAGSENAPAGLQPSANQLRELDREIDLSRQSDLEGYARDIDVSRESIERWISSGLLMPEELKVAEKLVKLMRKN